MRTRTVVVLLSVLAVLVAWPAAPARAQQTEKPPDIQLMPIGPPAPELVPTPYGLYDVRFNLELGGQFVSTRGNEEIYRSHLNYSDGFRVFAFDMGGKGREGSFFSSFYFQGAGWGGDPQNWARFGLRKDKWFDFKGHYRRNDYFWVFPNFARDQHRNDQQRRMQDYDITIFPQRPVRFRLGYTRNSSFGLAFTSMDYDRDEVELFEPIRQTYDEYRMGVEATYRSWNFFFEQGYRFFRNDRFIFSPDNFNPGNNPTNNASLNTLDRAYPIRGRNPFTRLTISGRPYKTLDVAVRAIYSDIDGDATRFEVLNGTSRFGNAVENIFVDRMDPTRPYTVLDASATWRPIRNLTLSNDFRFDQWNVSGVGTFNELDQDFTAGTRTALASFAQNQLLFEGYRNRFEARYDFNRWVSARGGFVYDHRDVRHNMFEFTCDAPTPFSLTTPTCPSLTAVDEELEHKDLNNRNFLVGVIVRPRPTLNVFFDLEHGNSTHRGGFTRLSPFDTDRVRLRARWEPVTGVKFSGSWYMFLNRDFDLPMLVDNTAPPPDDILVPGHHSDRNHGVAIDFQLTRFSRGYLDVGYGRTDVSSFTDIWFFAPGPLVGESVYIANENYVYVDVGGRLVGNLWGDAGYRVLATSGTFPASDPLGGSCDPFVLTACDTLTVFDPTDIPITHWGGLNFHQPYAAVRYVFSDNVTWKAGWRWYGYNVKGGTLADYKTHIVTTSLVLSF